MKKENYASIDTINNIFKNKKIVSIYGLEIDGDEILFEFKNGENIKMYHSQDCCETVSIEDINGDKNLEEAIFYEILEKECDKEALNDYDESFTWTFYTIRTSKGYLDIRWYGTSNGYYSESVEFTINYLS